MESFLEFEHFGHTHREEASRSHRGPSIPREYSQNQLGDVMMLLAFSQDIKNETSSFMSGHTNSPCVL